MNENIGQYWNRAVQYWNQLTKTHKITLVSTVVLLILAIGIISYQFSKTEYALAYTDLQASDAAAIQQYLEGAGIPYQLSEDGKSIGVPRSDVASVRIAVESQGLNQNSSIGYGAFDASSTFGITDREFDVKYVNAVQGELQQAINSITAISSSKVLISLPEKSLFLQQDPAAEQATASVVLNIKPGYQLDQQKADTIFHLVSHSVKNLPIENITLSDQEGNLLEYSKGTSTVNNTANAVMQHFEINNQFQKDIQSKVQGLLGTILGKDKVIVSVISTMNFDQKNTREQLVTAPNTVDQRGLEISVQELQKSYTSDSGTEPGGVAGTGASDVPTYPSSGGLGNTESEEISRTVNYEVNRIANEIVSTPYVVKDLTINVGIEPPNPVDDTSLTPETRQAVQQILVNVVRAALADSNQLLTDDELAKKVSVFSHSFARTGADSAASSNTMLYYAALGGIALALLGIGGFLLVRRRRKAAEALEQEFIEDPVKPEYPTIDLETVTNENQVRKQLEQLARKKPEDFVNLLRTWLVEE